MSGVRITADDEALAAVAYNDDGLVPAIVQDADSGAVLMMAWMSAETLALTLAEGRTVFWSRSRQEVWRKGETSGERQWLREAHYDCDGDTLLFIVDQEGGGACHTGAYSCFFRSFDGSSGGTGHKSSDRSRDGSSGGTGHKSSDPSRDGSSGGTGHKSSDPSRDG